MNQSQILIAEMSDADSGLLPAIPFGLQRGEEAFIGAPTDGGFYPSPG
jgi:hypothetical protein